LALGSKENAVMLPISLVIYDSMLIQGITQDNIKKHLTILLVGIVIVTGFGLIAASGNPLSLFASYAIRPFSLTERLLTESRIIIFYISLLLYPMPYRLNLTHDIELSYSLFNPFTTIVSIILIASIIAVALSCVKKRPLISFSIFFFFLNHVIESSILPLELIYEHRNYLPSMFFFVPFAILFIKAMNYFSYKKSMQLIIIAFTILVIVGQGHATYRRNDIWKSQESLWFDSAAKAFNLSRPHMNLGKCYFDNGLIGKAILENQIAIKVNRYLNTSYRVGPHLNLIACYFKINDFDNVIKHCMLAQEINPNISSTYDDLAAVLMAKGDLNAARDNLIKSLSLNKTNARAYNDLGRILLEQGHFDAAILELKNALKLDANMIEAIINIALAYKQAQDYSESIRHFKLALSKDPNPQSFENIYANLGLVEVYALIKDKKALTKAASHLTGTVNKERLLNIIAGLQSSQPNHRSLMDTGILLSEMGSSYSRKAEDCFRKMREFDSN
jgi:tetratricopeptide (TPR) repeat protein